jgi:hypothetical protein
VKKFIQQLTLSLALLAPFAAAAAGVSSGLVVYPIARSDGVYFVRVSGTTAGRASCGASNPDFYTVDGNTEGGRILIAQLRFARALGQTVTIYGTGTCPTLSTYEGVSQINHAD